MINFASISEQGAKRLENQDAVFCGKTDRAGIFLVADGMGGHSDGAYASAVVRSAVQRAWNRICVSQQMDFFAATRQFRLSLEEADGEIKTNTPFGKICGSTAVLLYVQDGAYAVISAGDSRVYSLGNPMDELVQLTADDVWENVVENTVGLTEQEILNHPNFGYLTRAVGVGSNFRCTLRSDVMKGSTAFALMSDGIYRYCPIGLLRKETGDVLMGKPPESAVSEICATVYHNGAGDNLSLILLRAEP